LPDAPLELDDVRRQRPQAFVNLTRRQGCGALSGVEVPSEGEEGGAADDDDTGKDDEANHARISLAHDSASRPVWNAITSADASTSSRPARRAARMAVSNSA